MQMRHNSRGKCWKQLEIHIKMNSRVAGNAGKFKMSTFIKWENWKLENENGHMQFEFPSLEFMIKRHN